MGFPPFPPFKKGGAKTNTFLCVLLLIYQLLFDISNVQMIDFNFGSTFSKGGEMLINL
jgi:hypothetical protein